MQQQLYACDCRAAHAQEFPSMKLELKSLQEERKTVLAKVDSILDDLAKLQLD